VLRDYQRREIERLAEKVKGGLDIRKLLGQSPLEVFGFRDELRAELLKSMRRVSEFGAEQVKAEMGRQQM